MPIGQQNIVDLPGGEPGTDKEKSKPKGGSESATAKRVTQTDDRNLRSRIVVILGRIGDACEARGDEELADIIREDTEVMATGLVSLTKPVRALRTPLVMVLGIVEPFMAFSRITRVMVGRILDHRAERHAEEPPQ